MDPKVKKSKKNELTEGKRYDEYKDRYIRALADYQNLEKRMMQERKDVEQQVKARILIKLFPIIDNLEQAEIFIKDPGLKLVKHSFTQFLQDLGVKELDVQNKPYDPHTAEVIEMVPGERDNQVVEVLKKGYELNSKVIRVAQVKVSKRPRNQDSETIREINSRQGPE